jgi:hypothetical protein
MAPVMVVTEPSANAHDPKGKGKMKHTLGATVGRGILAGLGGTVVMTAFQKLIEMPITGREDSYDPAVLAEKLLPVHPSDDGARMRLNYAAHFTLGAMWGAAYGLVAYMGLRGPRAVAVTFGAVYASDLVLTTALGLAKPWTWSRQDIAIDVVDKFVHVAATSVLFDQAVGRDNAS